MKRTPIPPPPAAAAVIFDKGECAGFLRVRPRTIEELLRRDTTFAELWFLIGGRRRVRRRDVEKWLTKRPTGWSPFGGRRPGAFGRAEAAPSAA